MGTYVLVSLFCLLVISALYIADIAPKLRKEKAKIQEYQNEYYRNEAEKKYNEAKKQVFVKIWINCPILFFGFLLFNWFYTPAIAWDRPAIYWEVLFAIAMALPTYSKDWNINYKALIALGIVSLGMLATEISSGKWIQSNKHKALLEMSNNDYGMIMQDSANISANQDSLFNQSISPVSLEKMRVVSPSVAQLLAETVMGQIPAFGSQYEIGAMSLQSITGEFNITDGLGKNYHLSFEDDFIYVAPLEFRSFWKWRQADGISKAYIIVSATNENIYHLVTAVNGEPLKMQYLQSSCFSKELRRHLRHSGFMGKIADNGIQIDGNGRPYNIFAKIENQIGWGGDKVIGSIVVDMQNGEIKEYTLNETPEFIDVVQPAELTYDLIDKHYGLIHGYFNWSDKDRLTPNGIEAVYGQKECCYYSGLTSVGNDASTSGFVLVNAKTGVGTFYKMSGIDENRAASAIQAHEWTAKYPSYEVGKAVMYNVGGLQTYYAPIISGRKIVGHGFCYLKNVNVVGAGKTKEEAYAAYMRAYHMSMQQVSLPADGKDIAGEVLTIKKIRQEGSRYNFLFEEYEGKTFYAFSEIVPNVRWIDEIGSKVKVDFRMSEDNEIPIKDIAEMK